jgi:AAA+ superfamily predicted ATPase
MVSRPTYEERVLIFNYYIKDKKVDLKVNVESLAKRTS